MGRSRVRYEDFTLVLSDVAEVDRALTWNTQVTAAAGLPTIIEPIKSRCDRRPLQALSSANSAHPPTMAVQLDAGRVSAGQLGVILREMGVRVALLNACKTASRDGSRAWGSVAASLLKAGVRSVVAMQHAVLDASAIAFAAAFYRSLALGGSLDEAARNGRIAVFDRGDGFGWGTPVLYLCVANGEVFPEAGEVELHRGVLQSLDETVIRNYQARVLRHSISPTLSPMVHDGSLARIRLRVIDGPDRGRVFVLKPRDRFVMGRAPTAHFQLTQDGFFSRHHLMVEANSPEVLVRDLKSMNGTFVNKRRILQPTALHDGDVISGGKTLIQLEIDAPGDAARAGKQPRGSAGRGGLGSAREVVVPCARCGARGVPEPLRSPSAEMRYLCAACQAALVAELPVLSGYRIETLVGRGTMGAVYLAVHAVLGRRVIRTMVPRVATSQRMRELFVQQAASHAVLEHHRIVRLFEVQELPSGVFCAVREYVEGGNAGDRRGQDRHRRDARSHHHQGCGSSRGRASTGESRPLRRYRARTRPGGRSRARSRWADRAGARGLHRYGASLHSR